MTDVGENNNNDTVVADVDDSDDEEEDLAGEVDAITLDDLEQPN